MLYDDDDDVERATLITKFLILNVKIKHVIGPNFQIYSILIIFLIKHY